MFRIRRITMKQVINGKSYNTDTAKEIGRHCSSVGSSDFNYFDEALYLTKNGTYFIAGKGGPYSQYSVAIGSNGRGGGSGIRVLSNSEALEWAENSDMNTDDIIEHFDIKEA